MFQLANFMERFFTENGRYDQDMATNRVVLPFSQSPQSGTDIVYKIALDPVGQAEYTLRATPVNAQAGDGYIELTATGARRWDQNNNNVIDPGESDWEK
ncbi:MAG: type IV pilin protein [Methylococcaceae bacterium]|nr:type IV pilin protein [Methylococcaceae bacterium]